MISVGTPAPMFMPAANHKFKDIVGMVEVVVPLRGEYPEGLPVSGPFDIAPEEGVLLFGTMVQVMFAFKLYPALEPKQRFVISGMEQQEEELVIVGRIVEFVEDEEEE